ncbi:hypothetical protein FHS43_001696 [Streptosporangium becharense]|uniref:SnoaL-like domain-containing protein n=1 Tax=Streptosporangium becharense TaxID=1816182 RepID=A0A7W9IMR2_9ACTN|nr:nuclear transport factor 2 family protein [Streptosporangium becharense]MBB2910433.1 hypothetical protein [Streptosporangium becharense]MBB5823176.1 hypothetical protein [Streptosporangium becharense]
MTQPTVTMEFVPAETYQRIQQFYARHMQLLDDGAAEEWAETFTEDAFFEQNVKDEPWRGREQIGTRLRRGIDAMGDSGVQRRHWFGMISARPGEAAGELRTRYYALVLETPAGGAPSVRLSIVGEDVLVEDDGALLVKYRSIAHDGAV